jgi:hypothetical protein
LSTIVGDTIKIELDACGDCGGYWQVSGYPSANVLKYDGEQPTPPTPGSSPTTSTSTTSTTSDSTASTTSTTSTTSATSTPSTTVAPAQPVTYVITFEAVSAHTTSLTVAVTNP